MVRQQKPAVGWRIVPWKSGELLIEVLEAEAEAKRFSVLEEKLPRLRNLTGRVSLQNRKTRNRPSYPISIPPFTFST